MVLGAWHLSCRAGEPSLAPQINAEVIAAAQAAETAASAASVEAVAPAGTEIAVAADAAKNTGEGVEPAAAAASEVRAAQADTGAASAPSGNETDTAQDLSLEDPDPVTRRDPYESLNRKVYDFNTKLDDHVMKPVAQVYHDVVPSMIRTGVSNVLGNLGDVWSIVNHLLQGKLEGAVHMTMRVATNTVFGLGGIFDQATEIGIDKESEDFGQTLGRWGVPPGPYVVLPLLGPSTARDTVAEPFDLYFGPSYFVDGTAASWEVSALSAVSTRAGLLGASQILNEVALDPYAFLRDAYLARRRNQVYDGNPPDEDDSDDGGDSNSR